MTRPKINHCFLILCLLAAGTLCAYWPAFHCGFVSYDDPEYVVGNLTVRGGLCLEGLRWAFSTMYAANWHPLTWLSHMLDCQLFGVNPAGHHATSCLLHLANTLLLFALLRRLTGALWRSALVAGLFAWHPLHVESVAWISERKDVLSTFFGLLSVWAYVRYVQSKVQSPTSKVPGPWSVVRSPSSLFHRPSSIFYLLALFLFACSLMSKPMLVTLPCLLLLLDFWPLGRIMNYEGRMMKDEGKAPRPRSRFIIHHSHFILLEKLPFFALSLASCIITLIAQQHAVIPVATFTPAERLGNALVSVARYLAKTLWPAGLAVFYPYVQHPAWQVLGAAVLAAMVSLLVVRSAARRPWLVVGWLWFLVSLTPVLGLVQVGSQAMADRYTYIPSVGLFIALSWGGAAWAASQWRRQVAVGVAAGLMLSGCILLARAQVRCWHDSLTLFSHARSVTGDNYVVCASLGSAFLDHGKPDQALVQFQAALRINPDLPEAHDNLAFLLFKQGKLQESIAESATALRLNPQFPPALARMGRVLLLQGDIPQAREYLTRAAQAMPRDPDVVTDLADALVKSGQWDDAVLLFRHALRLQPDFADARLKLARLLLGRQRTGEALQEYRELLRRTPDSFEPMNNLAWILATHPAPEFRNGAEAVRLAERAARLAGSNSSSAADTLAAAYAEAGRFADATATMQKAIALAQAAGQTNSVAKFRARLDLYQAGKPFHETR